jgi:hypothetical protein
MSELGANGSRPSSGPRSFVLDLFATSRNEDEDEDEEDHDHEDEEVIPASSPQSPSSRFLQHLQTKDDDDWDMTLNS